MWASYAATSSCGSTTRTLAPMSMLAAPPARRRRGAARRGSMRRRFLVRLGALDYRAGPGHDRVHDRPALPERHVRARQGAPADLARRQAEPADDRVPAVLDGRVLDSDDQADRHRQRADPFDGHRDPLLADQRPDRPAGHLHAAPRRRRRLRRRRSRCTDPAQVTVPYIGSVLPPFDTPTVDDHRGVEPYCTLTPAPCPLHDVTLTQALASGKPVAYMVGTPAHCQTGTCAPGAGVPRQVACTGRRRRR